MCTKKENSASQVNSAKYSKSPKGMSHACRPKSYLVPAMISTAVNIVEANHAPTSNTWGGEGVSRETTGSRWRTYIIEAQAPGLPVQT